MAEQLIIPGISLARLPFIVRSVAVQRAAKRALRSAVTLHCVARSPAPLVLRAQLEDEVLLAELRRRVRIAARSMQGRPAKRAAQWAATMDGRKVYRLMGEVSKRIADRQGLALCG